MKHLAIIQSEFLKLATDWDDIPSRIQRRYLQQHPKSKKRVTIDKKKVVEDPYIFENWLKGKRFMNVETKQQTYYYDLPVKQKVAIKEKFEKDVERMKEEAEKKKIEDAENAEKLRQQKKERRKEQSDIDSQNYRWTQSRLQKQVRNWAKDTKRNSEIESFGDVAPDLAESFLVQYPKVHDFLKGNGIGNQYHNEYITDLMM